MRNSPIYQECIKPVSVDELKLGMHVGNAALQDRFPMQPPSAHAVAIDDDVFTFADVPYLKALFAIKKTFADEGIGAAVFTRLTTLQQMVDAPGMDKWVRHHGEEIFEYADALLEVTASFPFRPGSYRFKRDAFLREVQRVADLKYGGQFT